MNTYCFKILSEKPLPQLFVRTQLSGVASEIVFALDGTIFVDTRGLSGCNNVLNILTNMSNVSKLFLTVADQESMPYLIYTCTLDKGVMTDRVELDPNDPETYFIGCSTIRYEPSTILHGLSTKYIDYTVSKVLHLMVERSVVTEEEIKEIGSTRIGVCAAVLAEHDDLDGAIVLSKLIKE